MPVLSKFYGIVIRMICIRELAARFHATYGGSELVVEIQSLRIVTSDAPARVQALVLEWARQHQPELLAAWKQLCHLERPLAIEPLR